MPPPVVLFPGRLRWAGLGLIFVVLTALGVWMGLTGNQMGWWVAGFFGLGLILSAVMFLPGSSYLKLTDEGFTMCTLYRAHTYDWEDVSGFRVGRVIRNKMVMFNFEPANQRTSALRSLNVKLVGYEAGLPDCYGLSHEELADLLNQYKAAHELQKNAAGS